MKWPPMLMLCVLCWAPTALAVEGLSLTEFLARGDARWVELHNASDASITCDGCQLRTASESWSLPDQTLGSGDYLVVPVDEGDLEFDRRDGYLALIGPSEEVLTVFVDYPEQRADISYGLGAGNGEGRYFPNPSPGEANGEGVLGFVADTKFSVNGGFFDQGFTLRITSDTPDATIRYTTDGSEPGLFNASNQTYTGPIEITKTTIIRAEALAVDRVSTNVDTQSYIFTEDTLSQPEFPEGFPRSWGDGPGARASMPSLSDYEMDPRIAEASFQDMDGEAFTLREALRSAPSLSLVLPIDSLLDPESGLYALAVNKGREWERPMSLEYFDPEGRRAFQVNGGLRMQGGWNRFPEMLKKSLRFYFRSEYGDRKLEYPLFPDSPATSFDTLILRSGNGKAWPSPWRPLTGSTNNSLERTTYLRDQLARDLQQDLGHPTAHGNFIHLYINGLYWGLYNMVERVDEWFGPNQLGGDEDDYDVIKWIRSEGMVISAGTDEVWQEVLALVRGDIAGAVNYERVRELVDLENLIDYMLVNFYIGNTDWPDNNAYTFRERQERGRFRFVCWDSEESLVSAQVNNLGRNNSGTPAEVFQELLGNDAFAWLLKDRIQKHFHKGGRLTDAWVSQRLLERAREIDRAIVAESARWGDTMRPAQPYTRDDWVGELENLQDHFFGRDGGSREEITFDQMVQRRWASTVAAPRFFFTGDTGSLRVTKQSIFAPGSVYFTTDGSDPRLADGSVNPVALEGTTVSLEETTTAKARAFFEGDWSGLVEETFYVGVAPRPGELAITEIMYHPASGSDPEYLVLTNQADREVNMKGAAFSEGIDFVFEEDLILSPNASAILTNDLERFVTRYGDAFLLGGSFQQDTRLSNGGETLVLKAPNGEVILTTRYDDRLPEADGGGRSLHATPSGEWEPRAALGLETGLLLGPLKVVLEGDFVSISMEPPVGSSGSYTLEVSQDLVSWQASSVQAEGELLLKWSLPQGSANYVRVRANPAS